MTARLGLLALAAAMLAFLVPQALEERDLRQARALAGDPATEQAARDALARARRTTLSGEPRILEAQLLLFTRRPSDAAAVVLPLVRREPENALAWRTVLSAARQSGDLSLQRTASARLAALDPRSVRAPAGR